jgi:inner membrane protein
MTEHLPFLAAYAIVTVMTITLISCFINGLTKQRKAVALTTLILFVEYGLILTLLYIGSLALLIGSLAIFVLIALAMYFTLKLKVENSELVIK